MLTHFIFSGWVESQTVLAYLDPGTGSYLLQMLIAGLLGSLYAIKIFWQNIKGFCARVFKKTPKPAAHDE